MIIVEDVPSAQVYGSSEALLTALQNLAFNALQVCPQHCELTLHLKASDETYDLTISDNGPGISSELQARVFEPFFTTRARGTGLGLAVVQAVIAAHGGAVWVDSEPGEGCRFTLCLPRLSSVAGRDIGESRTLEQS